MNGQVAVVTGASAGIGASVVASLVEQGVIVVGLARRLEKMKELALTLSNEGQFHPFQCDVSKEDQVIKAFQWIEEQEFGMNGVKILVNCAGIMISDFITQADKSDQFREIVDLNLLGALSCVREAIKSMSNHNIKGHVVMMNSVLGHRIPDVPVPMFNMYPATKFGMTALNQTIRQELRFFNKSIKVTSISPGMVDTDFLKVFTSGVVMELPKLRPEDVAAAVLYAINTPQNVQVNEIILEAITSSSD